MFDSFETFRAHCGEPTMPLEQCSICVAIPERCHRDHISSMVADYDVEYGDESHHHNDVPPQIGQLETLIQWAGSSLDSRRENVLRCPVCHRLYYQYYKIEFIGARNYSTDRYARVDVGALFRGSWGVSQRLPDRKVEVVHAQGFFRRHAIVRFEGSPTWFSLDDTNGLRELTTDELPRLIASDPPAGLDDPARARRYAELVGEIDDPAVHVIDDFSKIRWRELTDADFAPVNEAREASRVEAPIVERVDNHFVVRLWVVSRKRLICRVVTVRETGEALREDAVIAENLPVK